MAMVNNIKRVGCVGKRSSDSCWRVSFLDGALRLNFRHAARGLGFFLVVAVEALDDFPGFLGGFGEVE